MPGILTKEDPDQSVVLRSESAQEYTFMPHLPPERTQMICLEFTESNT
jgi:hypothetical protein